MTTSYDNWTWDTNPDKIKPEWRKYVHTDKANNKWPKATSQLLANWVYELVRPKIENPAFCEGYILDIGCGQGNLKRPWKEAKYNTLGIDIEEHPEVDLLADFLALKKSELPSKEPALILCSFPYHKGLPELAFDKIIELFGKNVPIIFWGTPRFRLCSKSTSKRYQKFISGFYPPIEGIITVADEVNNSPPFFQCEVYLFNLGLKGHWFYPYSK